MLLTTVWMAGRSVAALGGVKTHTLGPNLADAYAPHRDEAEGGGEACEPAKTVLAGAEMPTRPPVTSAAATRTDERRNQPPPCRALRRADNFTWILVIGRVPPCERTSPTCAAAGSQQEIGAPGALPAFPRPPTFPIAPSTRRRRGACAVAMIGALAGTVTLAPGTRLSSSCKRLHTFQKRPSGRGAGGHQAPFPWL